MKKKLCVVNKSNFFFVLILSFFLSLSSFAQNNSAFQEGSLIVTGGYTMSPQALEQFYSGVPMNRFGTTQIVNPATGQPFRSPLTGNETLIRDGHYPLYSFGPDNNLRHKASFSEGGERPLLLPQHGGVGMRLIPVADGNYRELAQAPVNATSVNAGETQIEVRGSEILDQYLREQVFGYEGDLAKNGPIFVQVTNFHPEGFKGAHTQMGEYPYKKIDSGTTHKAAYIGKGFTVNSPEGYANSTWWGIAEMEEEEPEHAPERTPYYIHVIDYKELEAAQEGEFKPENVNRNLVITNLILNAGVSFPGHADGYEFDTLQSKTLTESLNFYAQWLRDRTKLQDNDQTDVYCAEHTTMAINVGLNLIQNRAGYIEAFGAEEGPALWELAKDFWRDNVDPGFKAAVGIEELEGQVPDNAFVTLWKRLGLDNPFQGTQEVGKAMAWSPESVGDLMKHFASTYARWDHYGPASSIMVILGFKGEVEMRMNIDNDSFTQMMVPIFQQIVAHHVATELLLDEAILQRTEVSAEILSSVYQEKISGFVETQRNQILGVLQQALTADVSPESNLGHLMPVLAQLEKMVDVIVQEASKAERLAAIIQGTTEQKGIKSDMDLGTAMIKDWAENAHKIYLSNIADYVAELNKIKPRDGEGVKTVQYYYSPGVHVRNANGIANAEHWGHQFVRSLPVASVFHASHLEPAGATPERPQISKDALIYDMKSDRAEPTLALDPARLAEACEGAIS